MWRKAGKMAQNEKTVNDKWTEGEFWSGLGVV